MSDSHRTTSLFRRLRLRVAGVLPVVGGILLTGCAGYQIALQPTGTAGPLGVRQLPPVPQQAQPLDPASAAALAQAAAAAAPQTASSAPVQAPPPAAGVTEPAGLAAALTAPPITARPPATGASTTSPQSTSLPPVNGAAPMASPTATAALRTTPTPLPSFTATAAATPVPSRTPTPTATPKPSTPVQVYLPAGTSDFLYVGATMPVDKALAALAGQYDIVYFIPADGGAQVGYRPGDPVPPVLGTNTLVRIGMKKAMSFTMYPPN